MKYSFSIALYGSVFGSFLRRSDFTKQQRHQVKLNYRQIMERAGDIGQDNMLLSSYTLCAFFLAMNRSSERFPEENLKVLEDGFRSSKLVKPFLGDGNHYFDNKRMEARKKWAENSHQHRYANDWELDLLGPGDGYDMGYDYTQCGCCKLCAQEGCPDLAKYLCSLDFLLVDLVGIGLHRTTTLAEGGSKCDFRFYRK